MTEGVAPSRVLAEFMRRVPGWSQAALADRLGISRPRLNEILHGRRAISADTALRLGRLFGTTAEFWTTLQARWEVQSLARRREVQRALARIEPVAPAPAENGAGGGAASDRPDYVREFIEQRGLGEALERFVRLRETIAALERDRGGGPAAVD